MIQAKIDMYRERIAIGYYDIDVIELQLAEKIINRDLKTLRYEVNNE